jgi:hypothetical protein
MIFVGGNYFNISSVAAIGDNNGFFEGSPFY